MMGSLFKKMCSLNEKISKAFPRLKRSSTKSYNEMQLALDMKEEKKVNAYKEQAKQHYTAMLHIRKSNVEPAYLNVKNKSAYVAVFQQILADADELKNSIESYLENQQQIPEDVQKPITHLVKNVEMFQKRLEIAQQLNDANFARTSDYREAAREKLTDLFRSYFISKCMQMINDGIRVDEKKKYYVEIGKLFNVFLEKQGIYTKRFNVYDEIDFELLIPEAKKTTSDDALNGRIADLYVLPYFFNDANYQGHALISEGICVAYSTQ